jgi:hypothetical protein
MGIADLHIGEYDAKTNAICCFRQGRRLCQNWQCLAQSAMICSTSLRSPQCRPETPSDPTKVRNPDDLNFAARNP